MSKAKHLPTSSVNVLGFAKARAAEIALLSAAISGDYTAAQFKPNTPPGATPRPTPHKAKRTFQRLPRHLRRRTMSHNVKKLPLRLRLKAELEKRTCNGAGAETAVQTARVHKLRRRIARQRRMRGIFKYSKTLRGLERQHTFKWTPCHVWHAKRCAMCGIWGWKMAVWRNDSAQRAAFRAAQSAATIFDASSWQSLQISGKFEDISSLLSRLCPMLPQSCLKGDSVFTRGTCAFSTFLHKVDDYPKHLISPVQCLWKPDACESAETALLVVLHPAAAAEGAREIERAVGAFHLQLVLQRRALAHFELRGPRCAEALRSVFRRCCTSDAQREMLDYLSGLVTPARLAPGAAATFSVVVARLGATPTPTIGGGVLPKPKRRSGAKKSADIATADGNGEKKGSTTEKAAANAVTQPALLDKTVTEVLWSCKSTSTSTAPLLLVQASGERSCHTFLRSARKRTFLSGYDLFVPAELAQLVWRKLVFRGCHVVALRERSALLAERGTPTFPRDFPDSAAGAAWEQLAAFQDKEKEMRKPRAKRVNFAKLHVNCPFATQEAWEHLAENAQQGGSGDGNEGKDGLVHGITERQHGSAENVLVRYALFGGADRALPERFGLRRHEKKAKEEKRGQAKRTAKHLSLNSAEDEKEQQECTKEVRAKECNEKEREESSECVTEKQNEDKITGVKKEREEHSASAGDCDIPSKRRKIELLRAFYEKRQKEEEERPPQLHLLPVLHDFFVVRTRRQFSELIERAETTPECISNALVCVGLRAEGKGLIKKNALLFAPSEEDKQLFKELAASNHSDGNSKHSPLTKIHKNQLTTNGHCIGRATFGAYSYLSGRGNGIGFISAKHFAASNFGKWLSAAYKARKESQKANGRVSYEDTILLLQNNSSSSVIPVAMKPLLN